MLLLTLATSAAAIPPPPAPADEPPVRLLAPDALKAALFAPSEAEHRVVNFWATWCGPCKEEMPRLKAWAEAHPEVELTFVALDLPKLSRAVVVPFVEEQGLGGFTHLQLDDPDPAAAIPKVVPDWPDSVPFTLVVRPDGTIRKKFDTSLSEADLASIAP